MRRLAWCATAISVLALTPVAQAADRSFKSPAGTKIKLYDRSGTRLLRVSFQLNGRGEPGFDQAVKDMLQAIAEVARDQSSDVFAVTNMFCTGTTLFSTDYNGCAVEGAWLKPGEAVLVTRAKDNRPVYFSTAAALSQSIPSDWTGRLHLRDGLTGKVNVVEASGGSDSDVLGAATGQN
ncbi:MAG: hypothetical protein ACTHJR_15575 [Sphingomonas sp.]|uniref:hypothetical protein n=1 Tax=Sphingomonas sp. TaxID=28214 RepID=UPI003F7D3301